MEAEMKTVIIMLSVLLLSCASLVATELPYEGYTNDISLLRHHTELKADGKTIQTSSDKALSAATRLFGKVSFLFKTRAEVMALLGDPATISDYGVTTEKGKDSPLIYRFDTGFGGGEYKLTFRQDQVVGIEFKGLN
jgi:hypothetical protein